MLSKHSNECYDIVASFNCCHTNFYDGDNNSGGRKLFGKSFLPPYPYLSKTFKKGNVIGLYYNRVNTLTGSSLAHLSFKKGVKIASY